MNITVPHFISFYLGHGLVGTTPGNYGQCVGLVEQWWRSNGLPPVPGNAKDLPVFAPPAAYRFIVNTPDNAPMAGAVVCWGASWGGGFGHTAIVVAANVMALVVFEQNNPTGSPPIVATHSYEGVLGWIVPTS